MSGVACWLAVLGGLAASTLAGAAVHEHFSRLPMLPQITSVESQEDLSPRDRMLRENRVEPGSEKARIIVEWLRKLHLDPAIQRAVPGGPDALGLILKDSGRRESLMKNGLAHLTAGDRFQYLKLYTRLLDQLVPVNCFGLSDMGEVMDRIALGDMGQPELEEYLGLLYKVIVSSGASTSIEKPTPQQYAMAEAALSDALVVELVGDEMNMERYRTTALHPDQATPSDVCWATRVTLHAMASLPALYRDLILLPAMTGTSEAAAPRDSSASSQYLRAHPVEGR